VTESNTSSSARCAVIGDPIAHSKSPLIHSRFAEQTGVQLDYQANRVEPGELPAFVEKFFQQGGKGLNVTVPLKEQAFQLCQTTSPLASMAAAVNTLYLSEGQLSGENTDGPGLIRDIQGNHGFDLGGARILMLGAGGAVRGVLAALASVDTGEICLVNRTLARAERLKADLAPHLTLEVFSFEDFKPTAFDLVINGTSASLGGNLPDISADVLAPNSCCYDLMYADGDTAFIVWAKQVGARIAVDGLGMLVEQAADSFEIWHGMRPDTAPVIAELRKR